MLELAYFFLFHKTQSYYNYTEIDSTLKVSYNNGK